MNKIWDAAKAMDYRLTDEDAAFVQGARWALEQMTSEAAVKAFHEAWAMSITKNHVNQALKDCFAAVRKEIEG